MNTGIKALDTVINHWGINGHETENAFQVATFVSGRDPRVLKMNLPHSIIQEIGRHKPITGLMLHQFFVPHKKGKLACFVTDLRGKVLERVYYGHDRKYWKASEKVAEALSQAIVSEQQLAA